MKVFDVVIVGGGAAGSTLGANLAREGLAVCILEREVEFTDRVRGEWLAPWGVAECKTLGIYDLLIAAGGHHVERSVTYDELMTPTEAEAAVLKLNTVHPLGARPLCLQHVVMQNTLLAHAIGCGVDVRRGVRDLIIRNGRHPSVSYTLNGDTYTTECRLIVGADGRSSTVRRQVNLVMEELPVDHLISGLLVENAYGWPAHLQAFGKSGNAMHLLFPQGDGRIRLYLEYGLNDRGRYSGGGGTRNFLEAFDAACLPNGRSVSEGTPVGPCKAHPSNDAILLQPFAGNTVLIGDAAGYTDPISGQGLSAAMRDVRTVRDILLAKTDWSPSLFLEYAVARNEYVRRIRCVTRFTTTMFARFDQSGFETRQRGMRRLAANPDLGALSLATLAGPDSLPQEVFTHEYFQQIFAP